MEPRPIRVALDATALGSGVGGDETYLRALLSGLAGEADAGDRFRLLVRPGTQRPCEVAGDARFELAEVAGRSRVLRYGLTMTLSLARAPRCDLVHCDVYAPLISPSALALLLPDLSYRHLPGCFPLATRLRLEALVPIHLRQARAVLTVSEFSRRDIVQQYGVDPDRVFVVSPAVHPPEPMEEEEVDARLRRLKVSRPYFLYVGNLHPRKNVARLIRAFVSVQPDLREHRLVIAGGRWWRGGEEEAAVATAPPGTVQMLGRVDAEDRNALLRGAQALAYPSLFEGFGLPPVEAMAAGVPVLASAASAMPEVLGEAALLVDPEDEHALARGLLDLAGQERLRRRLVDLGRRQAARHNVARMGRSALAAYRAALAA